MMSGEGGGVCCERGRGDEMVGAFVLFVFFFPKKCSDKELSEILDGGLHLEMGGGVRPTYIRKVLK